MKSWIPTFPPMTTFDSSRLALPCSMAMPIEREPRTMLPCTVVPVE